MDSTVESTITEASVGAAAWQAAIDHGFFIIFGLAMGGNYPGPAVRLHLADVGHHGRRQHERRLRRGLRTRRQFTPPGTANATGEVTGLNGQCLANQNALSTEGNPMALANCDADPGQEWSTYTGNTVRVQGGCLDVVSAGATSGTNVDWYPCNGTNAQQWTVQSNGELVNPNSGLCLTGKTGARLDIETCTDSTARQWKVTGSTGGRGNGGATCGTTNLALNHPTTASSLENASFTAAAATDGNAGTRWSSAFSDPQWLEVDLGSAQNVCGVTLNWETAYATAFQIQVSPDNTNWATIYSTTTGTGGTQNLTGLSGTGRYICMYGTARATPYGYSLWEFAVNVTG